GVASAKKGHQFIAAVGAGEVVNPLAYLGQVILAAAACRRFADLLDGRQQQADQDGDDRDDHQQLDQREAAPFLRTELRHEKPSFQGVKVMNDVRRLAESSQWSWANPSLVIGPCANRGFRFTLARR